MKDKKELRIFGAGVRARGAIDLVEWQFRDEVIVEGYYEDRELEGGKGPGGYPILGSVAEGIEQAPQHDFNVFLALGPRASHRAYEIFLRLQAQGVKILSLIAKTAHISPSANIGQNALIFPGVYIGPEVEIGHLFVAFGGCTMEHDSCVGHNVLLGPGVTMSGFAKIANHSFIGVGSVIMPEVNVGTGTVVGAGSLVNRDIPDYMLAFGQPAVVHRVVRGDDEVPTEVQIKQLVEYEKKNMS